MLATATGRRSRRNRQGDALTARRSSRHALLHDYRRTTLSARERSIRRCTRPVSRSVAADGLDMAGTRTSAKQAQPASSSKRWGSWIDRLAELCKIWRVSDAAFGGRIADHQFPAASTDSQPRVDRIGSRHNVSISMPPEEMLQPAGQWRFRPRSGLKSI